MCGHRQSHLQQALVRPWASWAVWHSGADAPPSCVHCRMRETACPMCLSAYQIYHITGRSCTRKLAGYTGSYTMYAIMKSRLITSVQAHPPWKRCHRMPAPSRGLLPDGDLLSPPATKLSSPFLTSQALHWELTTGVQMELKQIEQISIRSHHLSGAISKRWGMSSMEAGRCCQAMSCTGLKRHKHANGNGYGLLCAGRPGL